MHKFAFRRKLKNADSKKEPLIDKLAAENVSIPPRAEVASSSTGGVEAAGRSRDVERSAVGNSLLQGIGELPADDGNIAVTRDIALSREEEHVGVVSSGQPSLKAIPDTLLESSQVGSSLENELFTPSEISARLKAAEDDVYTAPRPYTPIDVEAPANPAISSSLPDPIASSDPSASAPTQPVTATTPSSSAKRTDAPKSKKSAKRSASPRSLASAKRSASKRKSSSSKRSSKKSGASAKSTSSSATPSRGSKQESAAAAAATTADKDYEPDSLLKEDLASNNSASSCWPRYCGPAREASGKLLIMAVFLVIFAGLIYSASMEYGYDFSDLQGLVHTIDWDQELNVAFIGTAYLFVNDVPRVMQAISDNHIHQNSVIHPGGSLGSLLATGSGMYYMWQTSEAEIGGGYRYYQNYGGDRIMYDFGACTVAQLLQGYDEYIAYQNPSGAYYNDGLNPCIMDEYYASYVGDKFAADPPKWDYVVLADQTKRIAIEESRKDTIAALVSDYVLFLNQTRAIPVIVGNHAFESETTNMTGIGDVPTFTSQIHNGVLAYAEALSSGLRRSQTPIIAPVGLAYLTVWEEDYDTWLTLFVGDTMHSSPQGTYLFACVLYATLFGHLPDSDNSGLYNVADLFSTSRKIVGQPQQRTFPSFEEAVYLRNVAKRVVLKGYTPKTYRRR